MNQSQITNNKRVVKTILIIGVIAFLGFFVHKYLQFRTAFLEKQRIELAREDKKKQEKAEQKAYDEKWARCDTTKPIMEITYKDKLLSVNLDCAQARDVLNEISKKIGIKIDFDPKRLIEFNVPVHFNNLSISDGLNIISKNDIGVGPSIAYYRPDKNIWSFDKVIIEVKDPPKDGVTHVVETKDSLDFVKADGTNKSSYTNLTITKSSNERFILLYRYQKESTILNDQGELQWKTKIPDDLVNYQLSNNGKYIVADDEDPECANQCEIPISSYIINEKETIKINRSLTARGIIFSQDNNFFAGYSYPNKSFTVFDNHGNEISTKKTREEIKLIPGF